MKAVRPRWAGGPDVLVMEDVVEPTPEAGEVLVDVELAGVNFADVNARRGTYLAPGDRAPVLGLEVLGRVAAVGCDVLHLVVGDRVTGFCRTGGYAERACADARLVWRVPDGVSAEQAAALPVIGCTALLALERVAGVRADEVVLVTGAAGGVGTVALQVARALGAGIVLGAAGSRDRAALSVELGADLGIVYGTAGGLAEAVERAGYRGAVNVALDGVGGPVRDGCLDVLALFGRLGPVWRLLALLAPRPPLPGRPDGT